ncbi:MAG: ATP-binding protein [Desulfobacterales bacterium]|nr:ATP-binding protein [Desulfobacterales bacterium]
MKANHYARVRRMVLICMIAVPVIPFVLSLITGFFYFSRSLEMQTRNTMRRIVTDHRQAIESFLSERRRDLALIGDTHSFEALSRPQTLQTVFTRLQQRSPAFVDLGVFDANGMHVAYQGPFHLAGRDYSQTEWFKKVLDQGVYISDVFLGFRKVPHFIIAVVVHQNGGLPWVLRSTIDSLMFNELVKGVRMGKTGEAYILNLNGVLQTDRRSGGGLMEKPQDMVEPANATGDIHTFMGKPPGEGAYLYTTVWLRDRQWLLVVRQEKSDAFADLQAAAYLILLISIVGGGGITAVAFVLTGRIVSRIEQADAERDRLSQQLIGASRLAEIGEMAAGFAHEINNPLQIIKSEQAMIGVVLDDFQEGREKPDQAVKELKEAVAQIGLQVSRCAAITRGILKFGRQNDPQPQTMALKTFIEEVLAMVENQATLRGIALDRKFASDTPTVHADPVQLQQVFLNLFNNAMDAVSENHNGNGGRIAIFTESDENGRAVVRITDNGIGIKPENLKKIFSPFFTTKPVGKGTGLGLSVCYGIIENMGGTLDVTSTPRESTTFVVRIPRAAP